MNWFIFCYWFEPDAPHDPVGLVRIWTLAEGLTRAGDRVTVFAPRYRSSLVSRTYGVIPIRLLHWPVIRPLSYAVLSFIHGLLCAVRSRPEVIYYRWMDSPHVVLLAKFLGARCVCEVNGEPVPEWSGTSDGLARTIRHALARFALTRCDRVVVLTEGLQELLIQRYGISMERIALLPSGTDAQLFSPREAAASRRELGLPVDVPVVGFVGSFYRYQGLQCLLDAMVLVKQACPTARLLLVGDGEAAVELKVQAQRLGLTPSIQWAGRISYEQVPPSIAAMTVCVAPFRGDRGETSPVKIFDYLACGRPVVASAISSVEAVFTPDSGVRLVPPDNPALLAKAVITLLNDQAACAALGKQGRHFVERRFAWTSIIDRLRGWLREPEVTPNHAHSHLL